MAAKKQNPLHIQWYDFHRPVDTLESEQAALKQEAKLIRELRPKFNRAGVWPGKPQFLVWRFQENTLVLATQETP